MCPVSSAKEHITELCSIETLDLGHAGSIKNAHVAGITRRMDAELAP